MIKGKQSTICFHVNDCKISHVSVKVNDDTIVDIELYGSISIIKCIILQLVFSPSHG